MRGLRSLLLTVLFALLGLAVLSLPGAAQQNEASQEIAPLTAVFSYAPGYYANDISVRLSTDAPQAEIRYTLDGSQPNQKSSLYQDPILVAASPPTAAVIRARVFLPDGQTGDEANTAYFVGFPPGLALISLTVDEADLWDEASGIYANPFERGINWERPVNVTYIPANRATGFKIAAGLRIHGGWSRVLDKKSLRLYFRQEYGQSRLEFPLFPGTELTSFKRLILHAGGQDSSQIPTNWTSLRNPLANALMLEIGGYATASQPVLLFLNGEAWGVYYLRERIDEHFLADKYGVAEADLLDAPEQIAHDVIVAGDRTHWDNLLAYVAENDLADPTHFAYVQTQVNLDNLIDYTLLQIYAANGDWPFHNVHQFRPRTQGGRWHWLLWDADHTFAYFPTSSADKNMIELAVQEAHPHTTNRHTLLLRTLLQNPAFEEQFLLRAAHLLNTTFAPEFVMAQLDNLAAELRLGIDFELGRWQTEGISWTDNVAEMATFAQERPSYMRQHLIDYFDLPGTAVISLNPPQSGAGTLLLNGDTMATLPWQGIYFQTTTVQVTAMPDPGYQFVGWAEPELPNDITVDLPVTADQSFTPIFEAVAGDQTAVTISQMVVDGQGEIEGDWFELTMQTNGADLRGYRLTDNDSKIATDEGSLIFSDSPALANLPQGTRLRVIVTAIPAADDLDASDGRITLYVGNGNLDTTTDPWFNLGRNDNLALLAPGATAAFSDDITIAYATIGTGQTPAGFGALEDGFVTAVTFPGNE